MSCKAGRATSGTIPISRPSNIQPRKAATSTSHWPRVPLDVSAGADFTASVVFRMNLRGLNAQWQMSNDQKIRKPQGKMASRGSRWNSGLVIGHSFDIGHLEL